MGFPKQEYKEILLMKIDKSKTPKLFLLIQKPISYEILKFIIELHRQKEIEIVAIVSNKKPSGWWNDNLAYKIASQEKIEFVDNSDRNVVDNYLFQNATSDGWIISIQHPWIIPNNVLALFGNRTMNLHLAPLPEYRGWYGPSLAILNSDPRYGWTLHRIAREVDSGEVFSKEMFAFPQNFTARELYELTTKKATNGFKRVFRDIIDNRLKSIPQNGADTNRNVNYYDRKCLDPYRNLHLKNINEISEIMRIARALHFPPFPPLQLEDDLASYTVQVKCSCGICLS